MTEKEEYLLYKYSPKIDAKIHLKNDDMVTTLLDIDEISDILDTNKSKYASYDRYIEDMIKLLCNINIIISTDYSDITSMLYGCNSPSTYCYNITHAFDDNAEHGRFVLYAQCNIHTSTDSYDILTQTPVVDILRKIYSVLSYKDKIYSLITNDSFNIKNSVSSNITRIINNGNLSWNKFINTANGHLIKYFDIGYPDTVHGTFVKYNYQLVIKVNSSDINNDNYIDIYFRDTEACGSGVKKIGSYDKLLKYEISPLSCDAVNELNRLSKIDGRDVIAEISEFTKRRKEALDKVIELFSFLKDE